MGANIRAARAEKGMTQEALALRSGVSRNVLIDVEHGKRGILYERLIDIAEALDIPVQDLFADPRATAYVIGQGPRTSPCGQ